MRKSNFNESQRLAIIAEQDVGKKVEDICRYYKISPATFYKFKQDETDQQNDDRRRAKQLEQKNDHSKKMYASSCVRRKSGVLGLRRQCYYARNRGYRPEQQDERIAEQLHKVTKQFVAWGFWLVFRYLRCQGVAWNYKRLYQVW